MIPKLSSIESISRYMLRVCFTDGVTGMLDLSGLAGKGIFKVWDEGDLFFRPYISETGSISWSEQVDIDANNAYLKIMGITFDEWRQRSVQHATD